MKLLPQHAAMIAASPRAWTIRLAQQLVTELDRDEDAIRDLFAAVADLVAFPLSDDLDREHAEVQPPCAHGHRRLARRTVDRGAMTTLELARQYLADGMAPIPVPRGSKKPTLAEWQLLRLTDADLEQHFHNGANVGILNGEPSRGLLDIDLDCPEVLAAADTFLPATALVFGRLSGPRSHRVYRVESTPPATVQFRDIDHAMLVELRGTGSQTIWPPSIHPEGEPIRFDSQGIPAIVDAQDLTARVAHLAACALLARHWPRVPGNRHDLALAVAGFLLRRNLPEPVVAAIVRTAARLAGDPEARDRMTDVRTTARKLVNGGRATGGPSLTPLVTQAVVDRLGSWFPSAPPSDDSSFAPRDWEPKETKKGAPAAHELPFRTAKQLEQEPDPQVAWVARPWVPAGAITEVGGKVKAAGKTTWLLALAHAVIHGAPFLGQPTARSPVVFLTEQPRRSFKAAVAKAGLLGSEDFIYLQHTQVLGIAWPDVVAGAVARAKACGAGLLIVDTASQFAGIRDENSTAEALEAMRPLQVAAAGGLAVIISRHERKSGGEVGDAARGASAFSGAVDVILLLRRQPALPRPEMRVLHTLSRFDETPAETVIEFTDAGYVLVEESLEELARQEHEHAVLAVLPADEKAALTVDDWDDADKKRHLGIATRSGLKRTATDAALKGLLLAGRVQQTGRARRATPSATGAERRAPRATRPPTNWYGRPQPSSRGRASSPRAVNERTKGQPNERPNTRAAGYGRGIVPGVGEAQRTVPRLYGHGAGCRPHLPPRRVGTRSKRGKVPQPRPLRAAVTEA
jgi:AAA domain/Bifunctional DNA primase/polymerase, N-terminal